MQWRNTTESYGIVARALHWTMALIILGLLALGFYMDGVAVSEGKYALYGIHKSFGIIVIVLGLARIAWRQINPVPALPAGLAWWQAAGARASHAALYVLMMAMPLAGWGMSSAGGHPVSIFGLVMVPPLVDKDPALGKLFYLMHEYGALVFIALISAHLAAALFHHFVRRDNVLRRMLRGA